ncbi:hypothetical protein RUM43_004254 [Polyplax serrata]|uniref:Bis(5'-nucleosyl)-tetraphosphatase [asymmetrical] n=1 Tax=Polyplax serrata TaxID=468196 RepID=A0AAN8SAR2_POLSC
MGKRAAGFVIFRKITSEFEYLLLQTSYGSHHWTPPKGHVDPGESDFETALRETKEEAGFGKDDLKIVESFKKELKYTVNNSPKTVVYWLAELHKNTPVTLSSEHQDFRWGNLDSSCKLANYADFQMLLKECEDYLAKNYGK